MIQTKIGSVGGSDLVKMAGNLLDRPGIRRKTLCVDQQISYGNGALDRFLEFFPPEFDDRLVARIRG
jgi:hypothetical protein